MKYFTPEEAGLLIQELEQQRMESIKQINDNPFYRKKVDFIERFIAMRIGIIEPKSQAQRMIDSVNHNYDLLLGQIQSMIK